jgi:hypothetical protein
MIPAMRNRLPLLVLTGALVLLPAAPAAADDASVKRAWDSTDAQFVKASRDLSRAMTRWRRSNFRRSGPVLRVERRLRRLLEINTARVAAEQASTPTGARARRFALASNASFSRYTVHEARGVRLVTARKRVAGERAFERAARAFRRSTRQTRSGLALFRRAGVR